MAIAGQAMSRHDDPWATETSKPERMSLVRIVTLVACVLLVLMLLGSVVHPQVILVLLFGWLAFLFRTIPSITWNWDLVGMAAICTALILAGTHWFLNWICRRTEPTLDDPDQEPRWPWKRTWCGVAAIGLTFVIGSALIGAVHQIGWMMANKAPLMEVKAPFLNPAGMELFEEAVSVAVMESNGEFETVRRALWNPNKPLVPGQEQLRQTFHMLAIVSEDRRVQGVIIFPRDAELKSSLGGVYQFESVRKQVPGENIPELLSKHRHQLRAL